MREDQRQLLGRWRIRCRQIGRDVAISGIRDVNILVRLHFLKRPTFFTHDRWFFKAQLCHKNYCLVWLDLPDIESAIFIRRFLRHRAFRSHSNRLGRVFRLHHGGIDLWNRATRPLVKSHWFD